MDLHNNLVSVALPTEMTIGGRTYDILGFLREDERSVVGHEMVMRAKDLNAHLGEDDGQHFLDHQKDIPASLRGLVFAFTDWRPAGEPGVIYYVQWDGISDRWVEHWNWLGNAWYGTNWVLRRK